MGCETRPGTDRYPQCTRHRTRCDTELSPQCVAELDRTPNAWDRAGRPGHGAAGLCRETTGLRRGAAELWRGTTKPRRGTNKPGRATNKLLRDAPPFVIRAHCAGSARSGVKICILLGHAGARGPKRRDVSSTMTTLDTDLSGRTALVCGASGGIGLASAVALAELGCRVTCFARDPQRLGQAMPRRL